MKKILSILIAFFIFTGFVNAAGVNTITAVDNQTINVLATPEVIFSDTKIYGEVKVLRDVKVSYSAKDFENLKKVVLNLSSDLYANESYSIISVIGADGSIDFETTEFLGGEIVNKFISNGEKTIEKVNITDSRTIELYYNYDLTEDDFEFKILSELKVGELSSKGDNLLEINLENTLEKSTSYIVMLNGLENIDGNKLEFGESLFDLDTSSNLLEKTEEEVKEKVKEKEEEEGNVEEIALNSAETPDTGAETWVLVMLTFLFSTFYFVRNKFSK